MDDQQNYDFYSYGMRIAGDIYSNGAKLAQEVEEKYGEDARLEFECGFNIGMTKSSFNSIESFTVDSLNSGKVLHGKTSEDNNFRNNSYFGTKGVSSKYDSEGRYNPPGKETRKEDERGTFSSTPKAR